MDISLSFREEGSGFPLILLHGNGEDSAYFTPQTEFFKNIYHVYAIDTRGHGNSPRGTAPFTLVQFAEDLVCFMDEHNIQKAHILGFSDGANIALLFALKHPERIEKLILNGGNIFPAGMKFLVRLPVETGYRIAKCSKKESSVKKAELLGLMVNEPDISPEDLHKIDIQALVIAGTHDMIKEKHTRLIAENIRDAELLFIRGSHFVSEENPDAFNTAVKTFLEK